MVEKLKNNINKIFIALTLMLTLIGITFISTKTYAYTIDNNGNLIGDNLFNINDTMSNGAEFTIENNTLILVTNNSGNMWANVANDIYTIQPNTTYTFSCNQTELTFVYIFAFYNNTSTQIRGDGQQVSLNVVDTFTTPNNIDYLRIQFYDTENTTNTISNIMLNQGNEALPWEPYGVWYSETNYDTIKNLYENTLEQYNDLILANNYGYWKYIDYVEFYVNNSNIFVPNTEEQNEWEINDLYNYNILKIGGYFDTFPLTIEPYQSSYTEVETYINFKAYTPSDNLIISFNNAIGCNVRIYDNKSNVFTYTISENDTGIIDINLIRKYVSNFDIYVIDMFISPNNAEQNGIYFANNDYITAYNKGYNAATSNGDRKYIPQITELNNKIEQLQQQIQQKYDEGYTNGYNVGANGNNSLYNMVIAVADTPISIFKQIFNFNILGLDISGFIFGIISLLIIIWLIKKII